MKTFIDIETIVLWFEINAGICPCLSENLTVYTKQLVWFVQKNFDNIGPTSLCDNKHL